MSPWYRVVLDEPYLLAGTYHRLCRQFQRAYIAAGAPSDMALFASKDARADTRPVFFSPSSRDHASALLDHYHAEPCVAPSPEGVTLLYGAADAVPLLLASAAGPDSPTLAA